MTLCGPDPETIIALLSDDTGMKDIKFVEAYENEIKPTPVTTPIVAISSKGYTIGDKMTMILDNGEMVPSLKRTVTTNISLDIYLPYSMGGNAGHEIFDRIAYFLLYESKQNVIKVTCSDTEYDKSCQAIVLRSVFTYENKVG